MTREEIKRRGDCLKKQVKALGDRLRAKDRARLKFALQGGGTFSETTARMLLNGDYDRQPGQELIEVMEDALANFGKAKAS